MTLRDVDIYLWIQAQDFQDPKSLEELCTLQNQRDQGGLGSSFSQGQMATSSKNRRYADDDVQIYEDILAGNEHFQFNRGEKSGLSEVERGTDKMTLAAERGKLV